MKIDLTQVFKARKLLGNTTETVNAAALAAPKITQNVDDATETLTVNLTIKVTGEATTTNDIIQEGMLVEYFD